jgi:tRNA(Leu) C34 or U34 (ribose-2'-O)-methylase TrmL
MPAVKSFLDSIAVPRNKKIGVTPSILLTDPKFGHNVGAAIRAAACYDLEQVWYSGHRIDAELEARKRLPREERMKGYKRVSLHNSDYPFDSFSDTVVPVAIEVNPSAQSLVNFVHPDNALYVFGPEDGSVPSSILRHCHAVVIIPTAHCLNLATAVATVLYDRRCKRQLNGEEEMRASHDMLEEQRGEAYNDIEFLG